MIYPNKKWISKIAISTLLLIMMIASVSTVYASGWNVNSQFTCGTGSGRLGDSWLNWWGYSWWNDGSTNSALWRDSGGWYVLSQGSASDSGSSGNALVHHQASAGLTGWFEVKGSHTSDFFSGTKTSSSGLVACWS